MHQAGLAVKTSQCQNDPQSKRPKSKRPKVKTSQVKMSRSHNVSSQNVPKSKLPSQNAPKFWLWDIVTLRRFDLGRFDFGMFWLGTFWLRDILTWDILTSGRFDLGRFDFGTFWPVCSQKMFAISSLIKYSENILGTFWLTKNGTFWQITWDVLVLGPFDRIPQAVDEHYLGVVVLLKLLMGISKNGGAAKAFDGDSQGFVV